MLATQLHHLQLLKFTAGVRITSSLTVEWVEQQRFVATTFSANSALILETRKFTVFFRSSETINHTGFEMYIVCFRPGEIVLPAVPGDYYRACHFIP